MKDVGIRVIFDGTEIASGVDGVGAKLSALSTQSKSTGSTIDESFKKATKSAGDFAGNIKAGQKEIGDFSKATEEAGNDIPKHIGKGADAIKQLKAELREYRSEALAAGLTTPIGEEFLKKAAEAQHELEALHVSVENLATPKSFEPIIQGLTGIGAAYEVGAGAAGLFGESQEKAEETLKRLQSVMAIVNGLQEVQEVLLEESSVRLKVAAASQAIYTAVVGTSTGALKIFKIALAATGIGLVVIALGLLIANFDSVKQSVTNFINKFEALKAVLQLVSDGLHAVGEAFGLVASEEEESREKIIKGQDDVLKAITDRYDNELTLATAAGKKTEDIERRKIKAQLEAIAEVQKALFAKHAIEGKFRDDELKKVQENSTEMEKLYTELKATYLKVEKDKNDKAADDAKKALEKRKQALKDFNDAVLDLFKKQRQAELEGTSGQERIDLEKKISEQELKIYYDAFVKKGLAADKNFKVSAAQQEAFGALEVQIFQRYSAQTLKLALDEANAKAEIEKSTNASTLASLEQRNKINQDVIAAEDLSINATARQQEIFKDQKNQKLLEINRDFETQKLQLTLQGIDAEEAAQKSSLQAEILLLNNQNDEISRTRSAYLQSQLDSLSANSDQQRTAAVAAADNVIAGINGEIDNLEKNRQKVSFVKLVGLDKVFTKDEFQQIQQGGQQLQEYVQQLLDSVYAQRQKALNDQLDQTNQEIDVRDKNLESLKGQLQTEQDLRQKGLANNVDDIEASIAREQKAKADDLEKQKKLQEEKKKVAKAQFAVDTATQASSLITAAANIFETYSSIPYVGYALAVGIIAAMIGSFAAAKLQTSAAINKSADGSFSEGGYTGDIPVDQEAGVVHGQEFVAHAKATKKNRMLLEGLNSDDHVKMRIGMMDLLKDTGIVLSDDAVNEDANHVNRFYNLKHETSVDTSALEDHLDSLNEKVERLIKVSGEKQLVNPDGSVTKTQGNFSHTIKKYNG